MRSFLLPEGAGTGGSYTIPPRPSPDEGRARPSRNPLRRQLPGELDRDAALGAGLVGVDDEVVVALGQSLERRRAGRLAARADAAERLSRLARQQHALVVVEREVVVADLRPLERDVGLRGHLEVDVAVLAARGRDARRVRLVVARARRLDDAGEHRAVERQEPELLIGVTGELRARGRGHALAIGAVREAVHVVVDAVVADLADD